MAQRMLIDATHPEETRVAVVSGNRLEDLDYETSTKKQLKGNIYLAKVVRVEPSLQACFVDYGGNRHGFLAFSEIHPDYYRIPIADREALLAEQAAAAAEEEEEADRAERRRGRGGRGHRDADSRTDEMGAAMPEPVSEPEMGGEEPGTASAEGDYRDEPRDKPASDYGGAGLADELEARADEPPVHEPVSPESVQPEPAPTPEAAANAQADAQTGTGSAALDIPPIETAATPAEAAAEAQADAAAAAVPIETVGGDAVDEVPRRRPRPMRNYKIQEVIKRRQIMLVQVVKEERGNKGAALTTYLSLAGRYCVLMPNTTRGGGVSRKITNAMDRRRLKSLMDDLNLPQGMGVIVRTAGSERSKAEVKRDADYLLKLWDQIRELTLKSTAPCLIYEEANLIKRAVRDLYARDIDEIWVEGEEGYRAAKDYMKMLMPSHVKRVQQYTDPIPLFHRYQIEAQIDLMHSPVVQLKSGGYIVINPTEALVAIDVNSGRATRERFIEETALRTNMEAAEEVARQLRLRDLGGLVVTDFIDMEDHRNNHSVERRLKEALRFDRARIQVGRISPFGLLEMSRQRLRPSITETSTMPCPHCGGTGLIRSTESAALHVLRALEEEGIRRRSREVVVHVGTQVALYMLNQKRQRLMEIEQRYGFSAMVMADATLIPPDYRLERVRAVMPGEVAAPVRAESVMLPLMDEPEGAPLAEEEAVREPEGAEEEIREERFERAPDRGPDRGSDRGPERGPERGPDRGPDRGGERGERGGRRRRGRGRNRPRDGERGHAAGSNGPGPNGSGPNGPGPNGPGPNGPNADAPLGEERAPRFVERPRDAEPQPGNEALPVSEAEGQPSQPQGFAGDRPRDEQETEGERRRRRRGRRGGRRRGRRDSEGREIPAGANGESAQPVEPAAWPGEQPAYAQPDYSQPGAPQPALQEPPDTWSRARPAAPDTQRAPRPEEPVREPPRREPEMREPPRKEPEVKEPPAPKPPAQSETREERPRGASSAPANVILVDQAPSSAAGKRGWWKRLTSGTE